MQLQVWHQHPIEGPPRYVDTTPDEYANIMLQEGLDGHEGETQELNFFARHNRINVIVIARNIEVDESPTDPRTRVTDMIEAVYRVREPNELNNYHEYADPVSYCVLLSIL